MITTSIPPASRPTLKPQPAVATASRAARRDIVEFILGAEGHRIDRESGVIHDVKIIGKDSRNGGHYPAETLAAAMPLYEGARVNVDHPQRSRPDVERSFGDWFGVLGRVHQADDGLYGDLSYLKAHPLASRICEAAERFPESFGLSHNAQVTEVEVEGRPVYETIHQVRSVDIVCKPATTRGIFESEEASPAPATEMGAANDPASGLASGPAIGAASGPASAAEQHWCTLTRRLLDAYIANERPAHRRRCAVALLDDLLAAEAALTTPATLSNLESSRLSDASQRPAAKPAGVALPAAAAAHAVAESLTPSDASPATPAGVEVDRSAAPRKAIGPQRSASERARDTLEAVGLEPEPGRIVALASSERAEDRRELIQGWLARAAAGPAGAKIAVSKPRCSGFALESAASGAPSPPTNNWADPKLAALALLGH